ncbi:uncharacterized protein MELLADRAFT_110767 [Melampsora larici-populina 98AG31]|uniref:Uncharacterized protein n=1 Tax=Melampsora larici-populina (strain 98AG31 / pathotype 3-4-7) TaxID=747676 RepID=F4S0W8_MELLP|nr:uncharacterized protein MELLADRAFT_110767 [Melampsora larici-populina 98AG31]EGG01738.1 hypothetical protein MELLADRAFT_110767 [Melampsora larici-populina 98AG31]
MTFNNPIPTDNDSKIDIMPKSMILSEASKIKSNEIPKDTDIFCLHGSESTDDSPPFHLPPPSKEPFYLVNPAEIDFESILNVADFIDKVEGRAAGKIAQSSTKEYEQPDWSSIKRKAQRQPSPASDNHGKGDQEELSQVESTSKFTKSAKGLKLSTVNCPLKPLPALNANDVRHKNPVTNALQQAKTNITKN